MSEPEMVMMEAEDYSALIHSRNRLRGEVDDLVDLLRDAREEYAELDRMCDHYERKMWGAMASRAMWQAHAEAVEDATRHGRSARMVVGIGIVGAIIGAVAANKVRRQA